MWFGYDVRQASLEALLYFYDGEMSFDIEYYVESQLKPDEFADLLGALERWLEMDSYSVTECGLKLVQFLIAKMYDSLYEDSEFESTVKDLTARMCNLVLGVLRQYTKKQPIFLKACTVAIKLQNLMAFRDIEDVERSV